jgi:hypothetical protein
MTLNGPMTRLNRVATLGSQSADQFGAAVARTGAAASPLRPAEAVDHLGRPITCGLAPMGGAANDSPTVFHRHEPLCSDGR